MCLTNQDWLLDLFGEWKLSCEGSKANRGASLIAKVNERLYRMLLQVIILHG